MMAAVSAALISGADLLVEAGTGTGKTLAYLLPILARGERAIIATATRQLQSQILDHDLPLACAAAGVDLNVVALKGRSNYLCRLRIERQLLRALAEDRAPTANLRLVLDVARGSLQGDIAEVPGIAERDPIWPDVTSTADNCLGSDCSFHDTCFVVLARRQAMKADMVVVNHHLLLADHAVRERWQGAALLPGVGAIVIDEAHALEDVAAQLFGASLSRHRVTAALQELAEVEQEAGAAGPSLGGLAAEISLCTGTLFDALSSLTAQVTLDPGHCRTLAPQRNGLLTALEAAVRALATGDAAAAGGAGKVRETLAQLGADLADLLDPERADGKDGYVRQVEHRRSGAAIVARPVAVGEILQRTLLAEPAVRIFTSATLAMGEDFSHIRDRLGLTSEISALRVPGEFDYGEQALLYLPADLPAPFAPGRDAAVAEAVAALASAAGGGTFALFTSRRAMRDAWRRLDGRLPMRCLVQGEESREAVLARFVAEQPAVLFATMGFWQGVDLPGDVLRMVVIDKIPFPPPDDPLFAARARRIDDEGGSSFNRLSLPAASTALRQGFGRLIRSRRDRGVVAILDPRLTGRPYGRRLLAALPPARRTSAFPVVGQFLRGSGADSAG